MKAKFWNKFKLGAGVIYQGESRKVIARLKSETHPTGGTYYLINGIGRPVPGSDLIKDN